MFEQIFRRIIVMEERKRLLVTSVINPLESILTLICRVVNCPLRTSESVSNEQRHMLVVLRES